MKHEWFVVQFNYGGWYECACGFQAHDEPSYISHSEENGIIGVSVSD